MQAPELLVFNQIDRVGDGAGEAMARWYGGVAVSALHCTGLRRLLARAEGMLWADSAGVPNYWRIVASGRIDGGGWPVATADA